MKTALQKCLDTVQLEFGSVLRNFTGDATVFERVRPELEACLGEGRKPAEQTRSGSLRKVLPVAIAALAVAALVTLLVWLWLPSESERRWNSFRTSLSDEPGIVVTRFEEDGAGYSVYGLRDPLSTPLATLAERAGVDVEALSCRWKPYYSLEPHIVAARIGEALRPPESVRIEFSDGVLSATGEAPQRWIDDARRLAPLIPGVREVQVDPVVPVEKRTKAVE